MNKRPDFIREEHLKCLDMLRESGVTNMFGARPYLLTVFPALSKREATAVLKYWMKTFSERHKED